MPGATLEEILKITGRFIKDQIRAILAGFLMVSHIYVKCCSGWTNLRKTLMSKNMVKGTTKSTCNNMNGQKTTGMVKMKSMICPK